MQAGAADEPDVCPPCDPGGSGASGSAEAISAAAAAASAALCAALAECEGWALPREGAAEGFAPVAYDAISPSDRLLLLHALLRGVATPQERARADDAVAAMYIGADGDGRQYWLHAEVMRVYGADAKRGRPADGAPRLPLGSEWLPLADSPSSLTALATVLARACCVYDTTAPGAPPRGVPAPSASASAARALLNRLRPHLPDAASVKKVPTEMTSPR